MWTVRDCVRCRSRRHVTENADAEDAGSTGGASEVTGLYTKLPLAWPGALPQPLPALLLSIRIRSYGIPSNCTLSDRAVRFSSEDTPVLNPPRAPQRREGEDRGENRLSARRQSLLHLQPSPTACHRPRSRPQRLAPTLTMCAHSQHIPTVRCRNVQRLAAYTHAHLPFLPPSLGPWHQHLPCIGSELISLSRGYRRRVCHRRKRALVLERRPE